MATPDPSEVESPEPEAIEIRCMIRLPCGHMVDEPKGVVDLVCHTPWAVTNEGPVECGRKWHVWRKGIEILAREEF